MDTTIKNIYKSENTMLTDAFDRTVAEIHIKKQQNGYQTFLITGTESGVGTTTIAINLATSMATAGWKTLLIDGDMRKRVGDKRLNENGSTGLSDYLSQKAELKDAIVATNIENMAYMSCGSSLNNAISLVCSAKLNEMLMTLKNTYDYIIIDMPSMTAAIDASVVATQTDAVVLVTARESATKHNIEEATEQLEKVNANILGIIVNRVDKNEYKRVMKDYDYFKNRRYRHKRGKKVTK